MFEGLYLKIKNQYLASGLYSLLGSTIIYYVIQYLFDIGKLSSLDIHKYLDIIDNLSLELFGFSGLIIVFVFGQLLNTKSELKKYQIEIKYELKSTMLGISPPEDELYNIANYPQHKLKMEDVENEINLIDKKIEQSAKYGITSLVLAFSIVVANIFERLVFWNQDKVSIIIIPMYMFFLLFYFQFLLLTIKCVIKNYENNKEEKEINIEDTSNESNEISDTKKSNNTQKTLENNQRNNMFEIVLVALYGNWFIGALEKITYLPENNTFYLQIILLGLMLILLIGYFASSVKYYYMVLNSICLIYISFLEYAELEFLKMRNQITIYDQTKGIAYFAIGMFLWTLLVISDPDRQSLSDYLKRVNTELQKYIKR